MTMATCHECGAEMVRDIRPMEFTYKGHTLTVQQPGWYCACGEGVLTPEDSAVTQAEYVAFRDQVDGILPPAEVRRIRKRLGLQQKQAGVVLGGGASAFGKYERKDGKPSLAMSNLLRLLDKDPSRLQEIAPEEKRA
ncbi:putative DNA-binding transcriptional regulator [Magnetospirillum gryphiswaldense MSR-1 v2]|uniref:DNA-binding transcriptional regulator n=2 Tax=Magnetospirillum gryphiswaldense TaxID=55518 RepID=V6F284_MAGGM|nr:type II toxin-antitoxin system MqsA family antitoxin [Magnetospirillum gryphiswaldense]CAM78238.1 transcriptional regulator, XRE family [Magnetospirillum gryphiswaldense MSR-1]CDK99640.1 putative DNA-binding transcriptional regulator [Magnetospirillum gryphiswaldense MSR-1 v2]